MYYNKLYIKKEASHGYKQLQQRPDAVHKLRLQHSFKTLCRVLRINRSTYYKHFSAEPSHRIKENQHISSLLLHIHADCNKRLGAYKITYVLKRDYGINISFGRVYRLMKQLQLPKMSTDKPSVSGRHSENANCCNHLHQNFDKKTPDLVWVSDITYIRAGGKWYYLCIVMDLYSRKVISRHISANADTELVITVFAFRQLLDSLNVVQSFSKKGYPFDNACCECFFKYLKKEETNRQCYHSLQELQLSIFEYIEGYYNSKRPHTTLHMLTPNKAEKLYREQNA